MLHSFTICTKTYITFWACFCLTKVSSDWNLSFCFCGQELDSPFHEELLPHHLVWQFWAFSLNCLEHLSKIHWGMVEAHTFNPAPERQVDLSDFKASLVYARKPCLSWALYADLILHWVIAMTCRWPVCLFSWKHSLGCHGSVMSFQTMYIRVFLFYCPVRC